MGRSMHCTCDVCQDSGAAAAKGAISVEGASVTANAEALAMYDTVLREAIDTLVLAQRKLAWAANLDLQHHFTGTGTGMQPLEAAVSALDLVIDRAKAGQ